MQAVYLAAPACSAVPMTALSSALPSAVANGTPVIDPAPCTPSRDASRYGSNVAALFAEMKPFERIASRSVYGGNFRFLFVLHPKPGQTTIQIGRERFVGNNVVLPHASVSLIHATLKKIDRRWYVYDGIGDSRPSSNGVLVNGTRIYHSHPVRMDDIISLGDRKYHIAVRFDTEPRDKENQNDYELAAAYARLAPGNFESLVKDNPARFVDSLQEAAIRVNPVYFDLHALYVHHPAVARRVHQQLLDAAAKSFLLQRLICESGNPHDARYAQSRKESQELSDNVDRAIELWANADITALQAACRDGKFFDNRILTIAAVAGNKAAKEFLHEIAKEQRMDERIDRAVEIVDDMFGYGAGNRLKAMLSKLRSRCDT